MKALTNTRRKMEYAIFFKGKWCRSLSKSRAIAKAKELGAGASVRAMPYTYGESWDAPTFAACSNLIFKA